MYDLSIAFIFKNPQSLEDIEILDSQEYCLFIIVSKPGKGRLTINGTETDGNEGLAILPPRDSGRVLSGNVPGYVLGISWEYLKALPHWDGMSFISQVYASPWKPLGAADAKVMHNYFHLMSDAIMNYSKPFGQSIFSNLVQALTVNCRKFYPSDWVPENTARLQDISNKFLKLASENFESERELPFYADKLCITPKYLSDVIVKVTGKNAMKWIEGYTMDKAKCMLLNSQESISSISRKLNFYTPSDFCKYFKKAAGTTPLQYRKSGK